MNRPSPARWPPSPPAAVGWAGSIVWKLFGSVVLCLFVLLLFNLLLNNFVLVSYYQHIKQTSLENAFQTLDGLYAGQAGAGGCVSDPAIL